MFETQFLGKKKLLFTKRSEGGAGRRASACLPRVYFITYLCKSHSSLAWVGEPRPTPSEGGGCCGVEVVLVEAVSAVPLVVVVGGGEGDKRGRSGDNVCCGLCR